MLKRAVGVALLVSLGACGTVAPVIDVKKVPAETLQASYRVRTYTPETASSYPAVSEYLGPVTAFSCKRLVTDPPASKGNALEQLRIKALDLKADAVVDVTFDARGTDTWGTNCWESVQVSGIAVKVK